MFKILIQFMHFQSTFLWHTSILRATNGENDRIKKSGEEEPKQRFNRGLWSVQEVFVFSSSFL